MKATSNLISTDLKRIFFKRFLLLLTISVMSNKLLSLNPFRTCLFPNIGYDINKQLVSLSFQIKVFPRVICLEQYDLDINE